MKLRKSHRPLRVESLENRLNMAAYTVNTLADNTASDAVLTLREATLLVNNLGDATAALGRSLTAGETAQVNTSSGLDNIFFDSSITDTPTSVINLSDTRLNLTRSVEIQGPGADKLVISGQNGRQHFFIDGRTNGSINVAITGLSLFNGRATGSGGTVAGGVDNSFRGGSIFNDSANVILAGNYFAANQASFGGAIYTLGGITSVDNSTIYNNTATNSAGGLKIDGGTFHLRQSTVGENQAPYFAGGIVSSGNLVIQQSTIVYNRIYSNDSTYVGGVYTSAGTISLQNTVVSGNTSLFDSSARDIGGVVPTGNNNYIGNTNPAYNGGFTHTVNGNLVQSAAPDLLGFSIRNNGGTMPTYLPSSNSPLLEAGNDVDAPFITDQRGGPRTADGPDFNTTATVDIGAVEGEYLVGPFRVSFAGDDDDGNYAAGDLSLREAIRLANTYPAADTITFAKGITTVSLTLGKLTLTDIAQTTITGNGVVVERSSGASNFGIFQINSGARAELQGLTIRNGNADVGLGGGIYSQGTLTVINSTLSGNSAGGWGGGIAASGTLTVTNSTFSGNSAGGGGGAISASGTITVTNSTLSGNSTTFNGGAISNAGTLTVTNSTLSGNSATANGGGISNVGTLTVINSTLSGNSTTTNGGGISNGRTLTVTNSTLSGNLANSSGGGLFNDGGQATLIHATLTNNRSDADGDNATFETGGGIWTRDDGATLTKLHNSLVGGNFIGTGTTPNDLAEKNVESTSTNNLIGDAATAGGLTNGTNGNQVGIAVATVLNPTLANNGGPTLTHALIRNSPAINAGLNTNAAGLTTDQRGTSFARILGTNVDIGAVEQFFAPTAFTLTPNLTQPSSNQQITITVNLTGSPTPTGTVSLVVNNVVVNPTNLVDGQGTVILNGLPVGLHTIFARYSGDPNYNSVDSAVLNQQVFPQSDVNRSGAVEINDILAAIFMFNTYATPIAVANLPAGPPFPDASGDGQFDINDLLRIIFDFNQTLVNPEGETAPSPSASTPTSASTPVAVDEVFADDAAWLWDSLPTTRRRGQS